jgi:hypothetical protein
MVCKIFFACNLHGKLTNISIFSYNLKSYEEEKGEKYILAPQTTSLL